MACCVLLLVRCRRLQRSVKCKYTHYRSTYCLVLRGADVTVWDSWSWKSRVWAFARKHEITGEPLNSRSRILTPNWREITGVDCILSEIALDWMSMSQRQDWFRLWLGVGQPPGVWLPQGNATFSRSLSNKFTASPYVCFNGFRRLLVTGPREYVTLKPQCLNIYVRGPVLSIQITLHTDITTAMQSEIDWGSHVTAGWSCDYFTHAQRSTAAMMCLFWWE